MNKQNKRKEIVYVSAKTENWSNQAEDSVYIASLMRELKSQVENRFNVIVEIVESDFFSISTPNPEFIESEEFDLIQEFIANNFFDWW